MKSLKEYITESEVFEADDELDMSNATVKKLSGLCDKAGYKLKMCKCVGGNAVIKVIPFGPGYKPEITYSSMNKRTPIEVRIEPPIANSSVAMSEYAKAVLAAVPVVKFIEGINPKLLPDMTKK